MPKSSHSDSLGLTRTHSDRKTCRTAVTHTPTDSYRESECCRSACQLFWSVKPIQANQKLSEWFGIDEAMRGDRPHRIHHSERKGLSMRVEPSRPSDRVRIDLVRSHTHCRACVTATRHQAAQASQASIDGAIEDLQTKDFLNRDSRQNHERNFLIMRHPTPRWVPVQL